MLEANAMDESTISDLVDRQRAFFAKGTTKDVSFRIGQLKRLRAAILENQEIILDASRADMGKPAFEYYVAELGFASREIRHAVKNLKSWLKPIKVSTPLMHLPASSYIYPEPLGVVLIIGPWNYPLELLMLPLIGAIAAGNCAILKPSEVSPHTSATIAKLIQNNFDTSFIAVVEGGVKETQILLSQRFEHIFFTGGTTIGQVVMEAAAKHLTPVTLELGGKTPCIVDRDVNVATAARRIVWGKFLTAGQNCVAPDYVLVHKAVKEQLVERMIGSLEEFYGKDPSKSPDYGRIINDRHFLRLAQLLGEGRIIVGGHTDPKDRYIAPTIIDNVSMNSRIMAEEIFGPILPIMEYADLSEAISIVKGRPKPLALYFFSKNRKNQQRILRETSSGGVCINDTNVHISTSSLPFGGVGASGMGSYHGKASFYTFSHTKSTMKRSFLLDMKIRYPPYKDKLKLLKRLIM
jgi:acyl-CoA reductase-like NAD-dependent aldehyde dehydrogenase